MSDQLRELVQPFGDVEPPLDLRSRISEREALVAGRRPPLRIPRMMVVATATIGVVLVIGALALAAHTRSTAPQNEGSNTKLRPVTQAQLDGFLTSVRSPLDELNTRILIANHALDAYQANPSATNALTWRPTIVNALRRIGHDLHPLKSAAVPRPLRPTWTDFVEAESNDSSKVVITGTDLRENNTGDLLLLNYVQPIDHLKSVLLLCAAANHLKLPSWVGGLGTGTPNMPIPHPVKHAEFDVFLNLLAPRVSQLQLDIMLARQDLDIYAANRTTTAGPKRSATALGDRLVHVAIDQIGASDYASLTAVTPPRELAVAWSTFLDGVKETATAARVGGFDLQENKLPYARNGKRAYFAHLEQPILRLKAALEAYAAVAHVSLPAWLDKLGTSK